MAFHGDGDTFAAFSGLVPVCFILNRTCMTDKKTNEFRIRACSKRELAALYFPETVDPNVAVANLRYLFHRNPELRKALAEAHYHPRDRMLTPLQVRAIVEFLGEP